MNCSSAASLIRFAPTGSSCSCARSTVGYFTSPSISMSPKRERGTARRSRPTARPRARRGRSPLRSCRSSPPRTDLRAASRARCPWRTPMRPGGRSRPAGRPHSFVSFATASVPSGASATAGPVTSMLRARDPRRLAGRHRHRDDGRFGGAIDRDLDARGEIAFRRRRVARFVLCLAREALEKLRRHVGVVLPAHDADAALDRRFERRRRVDDDAIRRLRAYLGRRRRSGRGIGGIGGVDVRR